MARVVSASPMPGTRRCEALDIFRVVCAVMVVGIHTHLLQVETPWLGFVLGNGLFRVAVPFFLMLSGYYWGTRISSQRDFIRWGARILGLYAFWMLIYLPFYAHSTLKGLLPTLVFGYHHLWFVPAMLLGGAMLYGLRSLSAISLLAISGGLFLGGLVLQYGSLLHVVPGYYFIYRNFLFFGFPLMALGYVAQRENFKLSTRGALAMVLVGLAGVIVENQILFNWGIAQGGVDFYLFMPALAGGFLMMLQNMKGATNLELWPKFWMNLSSSMYFVHPLFIAGVTFWVPQISSVSLFLLAAGAAALSVFPLSILAQRVWFVL
jgi:surface polysaccharide O-acyltransferase-like enzyme